MLFEVVSGTVQSQLKVMGRGVGNFGAAGIFFSLSNSLNEIFLDRSMNIF